jgi:hypothetical protein
MDIEQFTQRQQALLPPWFGDAAPILQAVLQGSALCNEFIYSLSIYLRAQMRLQTMGGDTLDLFAQDYFGNKLLRHFGEADNPYRTRISASLLRSGATRPAMVQVLTELTGRAPVIWEAGIDSGFYNYSFCNYTTAGSSNVPYQAWIIVYRPVPPGQAGLSFFNYTTFCNNSFAGGLVSANVTDQDILDAIQNTKCEGTLMHVTILD